MLTLIIIPMLDGPPYEYYQLECDSCGVKAKEKLSKWSGEAHVMPVDWMLATTKRPNWPRYALAYDLCPDCDRLGLPPSPKWEASWAARKPIP